MIKKKDFILIAALLLLSGAGALIFSLLHSAKGSGQLVTININGNIIEQLDLNQDQEFTIQSGTHGTNQLVIQGGQAFMTDASCPDKVCIHQGKITEPGQIIVCLPNAVIVSISDPDNQ